MNILTLVTGQSNCNRTFQNEVARLLHDKSIVHASYYGGEPLSNWVAGTAPSYTRGTRYTDMTAAALGLRPDRVVLNIMQGENDTAGDGSLAALWTGKLDAMIGFLQTDFETTDVKVVIGMPWPQDSELPPNVGYTTLRAAMITWQAANPAARGIWDSADLYRPPGNVHYTEWTALNVPGATHTAAARAVAASNKFYN